MAKEKAPMDRDLHILVNTPDHLVIDRPAVPLNAYTWPLVVLVILGTAFVVWKTWSAARWFSIGLIIAVPAIGLFVYSNQSVSNRMDMDRATGKLTMTTYRGNDRTKPTGTYVDPLDAFVRADIEFDRDFRRITLSTSDGQQVRPLGQNYEVMDSQFLALGAIQRFIGQTPAPAR